MQIPGSSQTLNIPLRPSRKLRFIYLGLVLSYGVMVLLVATPVSAKVGALLLLGIGCLQLVRRQRFAHALEALLVKDAQLYCVVEGKEFTAELIGSPVVMEWAILLTCKVRGARQYLSLLKDCMAPEDHRQLRVMLNLNYLKAP